ncbi:aminotransferase class-III domain-containing protein [Hirsutella rhossiliensis]|uniref:Aminotransferase class-III domain-containing protein n=1 Tax=Hirsutella rhossiliensis TaxID=111463 RepID=A0A9P8MJE2_9HYPO|nr:aminotransferase class-III domain-containing protein [Hirsutella rhossiliensis]KAH0957448.1 aminotransferase class-III domain-containing protein [Hirsutella rhossiliensis]
MPPSPARHGLQQTLDAATARYVQRNPKSKALHDEAAKSLPGGGTRSVLYTDPFPLSLRSGHGHAVTTEDGHNLVDLLGDFTAGLYGHSHPVIQGVARHIFEDVGLHMGGTVAQEQLLASAVCQRFGLELVRFTSSGTEANLQALAAARHFTKKRKIVVFANGYHGSVLGFAGGQAAANNVDVDDWIVAEYNHLESAAKAIRSPGVAAVLMEGMQSAGGCVCGTPEFLACVEQTASEVGVLFILDEVATSRLSAGGLAGIHELKPDLKSLGKWLGGGVAFGAFGGRADVMAAFDARLAPDALPHSGTFNNNTLAMHLGHAGLTRIYTPRAADDFTARGDGLRARLDAATEGTRMHWTGRGTLMSAHFAADGDEARKLCDLLWFEMLEAGFWIARRGLVALILGTPQDALDRFVECVGDFVSRNEGLIALS